MRYLSLFVFAAAVCGCMTLGRPFDVAKVPQIQIGKTTRAELQSMFGEPYRIGVEDGNDTATWLNYHFGLFGGEKTRDLYVKFNPDATVKSYSFNSNLPEDEGPLKGK